MIAQRYVYALQIEGTPFLKLGISTMPHHRIQAFQPVLRKHGLTCRYVAMVNVPEWTVWHYEMLLHQHFAAYRIIGEWFCAPVEMVKTAMEALIIAPLNQAAIDGRLDMLREEIYQQHNGGRLCRVKNGRPFLSPVCCKKGTAGLC